MRRRVVSGTVTGVDKDTETVSIDGNNFKVKDSKLLEILYKGVGETTNVVVEDNDEDSTIISIS